MKKKKSQLLSIKGQISGSSSKEGKKKREAQCGTHELTTVLSIRDSKAVEVRR